MARLLLILLVVMVSCNQKKAPGNPTIERIDPALDAIIDTNAKLEILADGFQWTEGPVWVENEKMLLFSDVFKNTVFKWTAAKGQEVYLAPSGYTGTEKRGGELGSNGLTLNANGQLVLCQHGNRQVALMNAPINDPKPEFTALAQHYQDKRFNSPNDLVFDSKGNLYFTDPPYGLEKNMADSSKEVPFQGVYRVDASGNVTLLTDSITRPNGIALTPDEKQLIISNSDSLKSCWYIYDLNADGTLANGKLFYNAQEARNKEQGNPDGLKIDKNGNVFATGPGGVWIFNKAGKLLGKIKAHEKVSNCAFSPDEKTLYITATNYLLRMVLRK